MKMRPSTEGFSGQSLYYFNPHTSFWSCIKSPDNSRINIKIRSSTERVKFFYVSSLNTSKLNRILQWKLLESSKIYIFIHSSGFLWCFKNYPSLLTCLGGRCWGHQGRFGDCSDSLISILHIHQALVEVNEVLKCALMIMLIIQQWLDTLRASIVSLHDAAAGGVRRILHV